jgi:hypothetical protein
VTYPRLRPGYGQHPVVAALLGFLAGAVALAALTRLVPAALGTADWVEDLSDTARPWVRLGAAGVGVIAVVVAAWSLLKLAYALSDVFADRTVEGLVLRARVRGSGEDRQRRYYVAVDAGAGPRVAAWRVAPVRYGAAPQGTWVRVVVTPRLCHVRSVEGLPGRPAAATEARAPVDDPALAEAAQRLAAERPPG